jgi:hypothetical protein
MTSIGNNKIEMVKLLLEYQPDLEAANQSGETALHIAAWVARQRPCSSRRWRQTQHSQVHLLLDLERGSVPDESLRAYNTNIYLTQ